MKITKTKYKGFPHRVTFDNKRSSYVPDQRKFKTDFIRHHGCSLAAFYIALGFCGKPTNMIPLLKWCRKNLKAYMKSKLTIKGVAAGLNKKSGRKVATYHRTCSSTAINKALNAGHLILLETGNPIHTNVIYRSSGHTYHLDHGNVRKIDYKKLANNATKHSVYRGWVEVTG